MKLTIDRTRWNGGGNVYESSLLRDDGKMCCLGFYCLAKGKTPDEILGFEMPASLPNTSGLEELVIEDFGESRLSSLIARRLAHVNDINPYPHHGLPSNEDWTLAMREAKIIELFKTIGVEVEFIN